MNPINSPNLAFMLAWQDTKQAYRRSAIGPFWLTIGMAVQILTIGIVFGIIFKAEIAEYLPFLGVSIILWNFISMSINDGCVTFVASEAMIKQLGLPHYQYVIRTVARNVISLSHNLILLPIIFIAFLRAPNFATFSFIPGLLILLVNITWVVWLLGLVSARYRDMPPMVSSLMTVVFYVTPVMWYPTLIDDNELAHVLLGLNPIYHWLQLVRLPILGTWPTLENWSIALVTAALGWAATLLIYKKYRNSIAYWI